MQGIKINMDELKMGLTELISRCTRQDKLELKIDGRDLTLSAIDDDDNIVEVVLNHEGNMQAKFRHTERLMSMKKKGSL